MLEGKVNRCLLNLVMKVHLAAKCWLQPAGVVDCSTSVQKDQYE